MEPSARELVLLRIHATQGHVRINWTYRGHADHYYTVPRDGVIAAGEAARTAMAKFVTGTGPSRDNLIELAIAGNRFYHALFQSSTANRAKEKFESQVELQEGGVRIQVCNEADRLHLPLGLAWTPPIRSKAPKRSRDLRQWLKSRRLSDDAIYAGFWNVKYNLVTTYEPLNATLHTVVKPVLLGVVNAEVTRRLKVSIPTRFFRSVFKRSDTFLKRWSETTDKNHLLYMFGHANGGSIQFSMSPPDVLLAAEVLEAARARHPDKTVALLFMNGCSTGTSFDFGTWAEAAATGDLKGFVGTEVGIPDEFAWWFGVECMEALLSDGRPLIDVFSSLRAAHLPLSLAYGVYCVAEYRLEALRPRLTRARQQNLSSMYWGAA
jgi:hypothetical protein